MITDKQRLSSAACADILRTGETGMLSTKGLDEFPYAVPVNYVFRDGKIYIHGKPDGTKIDCIRADAHVSFCVIGQAQIVPEDYTTDYTSVIVYGMARVLTDPQEMTAPMRSLMEKYAPGEHPACMQALESGRYAPLGIVEITPVTVTGKRSV